MPRFDVADIEVELGLAPGVFAADVEDQDPLAVVIECVERRIGRRCAPNWRQTGGDGRVLAGDVLRRLNRSVQPLIG